MQIPFFRPDIGDEEINEVTAVLKSGWLTTGPKTAEFEQKFAAYIGGGVEAVAVNSATAGLHLAAEACGIGPGDAVIVPTLTFTATAEVVAYLGAEVVFADVVPGTNLIDLADAERRMMRHCKAIIPVHFGGLPCDMEAISAFARDHGLKVIEDAAHALPARSDGRLIGAWGSDATVFSFYANKPITTGEGGMLVTPDRRIAERARTMRTHGMSRNAFDRYRKPGGSWEYDVVGLGYKYNMTDVAAAIGVVQLGKAERLRNSREEAAMHYFKALYGLPIDLPSKAPAGSMHAWHIFSIHIQETAGVARGQVIAELAAAGVATSVHYRPLHAMSYWKQRQHAEPGEFPVADRYFAGALTLPLFPGMTAEQVNRVVAVLRGVLD